MNWSLIEKLSNFGNQPTEDTLLEGFLSYVKESRLELYPAQEEAILELLSGKNVILNTPTGSGKSLVATALHYFSIAHGRRSIYTCPIKALVNEKFLALCRQFSPENVGMITGDASVNPNAPIICCTAEILAIDALRYGKTAKIDDVIMDEFHYYSDRDRGVAWQVPLLTLPQTRFLLMSATMGDTELFEKTLTQLNQRETVVVKSGDRPVPLSFEYSENPLHETVGQLLKKGRAPVYIVNFSQRECAEVAQNFLSIDFCTKEEKKAISDELYGFKFQSPYGKEIQKLIRHGIGIHHAGLLPKYRILIERLAQKGMLKLICGTDTLGVGVNVPIRTVVFTKLCKFDGEKTAILNVRDFQQISGRAGRRGYDQEGFVVIQAPEHVIENLRMEQKASGDPKKLKKIVKRKPPEKGYVPWNRDTYIKLTTGAPEALTSRFKVTHAMLLHVLSRKDEDGCRAMQKIVRMSHESDHSKRQIRKVSFQLFRSLVERKIIEFNPLRVNVDLQEDFSLNHALSLYLIDTIKLLDPEIETYSLDILTLAESIVENPDLILRKQLDQIKAKKLAELKNEGVEYEERIQELENLEYPKPNREFIYNTFNAFSAAHPWIGAENIRPKSIAREMYETFSSFSEYVRDYGLQRAEGVLLRYLSEVYKVLVQTVPDAYKTDEFQEIIVYLGSMVRQIDSSLLDEWEKLKDPTHGLHLEEAEEKSGEGQLLESHNLTRNRKKFEILIRNEIFKLVRLLSKRDYESIIASFEDQADHPEEPWSIERLESKMNLYLGEDHQGICTDPKARSPRFTTIQDLEGEEKWLIHQTIVDPDDHNDWYLEFMVDLERSKELQKPVLSLRKFAPIGQ